MEKKSMKCLKGIILVCLIFLTVFFVFISQYEVNDYEGYDRRFVLVAPLKWPFMPDGAKQADREFGTHTKLVGSDRVDPEAQIRGLENAILTKADGVITASSAESEELKLAISRVRDSGIPVVLVDADLPGSERNCYIGTNNLEAGRMAGQDMQKATEGKAQIGIIVSAMTSTNQQERVEGFMEIIDQNPEMEVVEILECHSDTIEINQKCSKLLAENPQINALYLTEATGGTVVGNVIKKQRGAEKRPVVVAFDVLDSSLEYLKEGIYYSIINQSMYDEGYEAVKALCKILDGETADDVIYTDVISVTRENYMEYEAQPHEEMVWYDS